MVDVECLEMTLADVLVTYTCNYYTACLTINIDIMW
jgi:hypothetical protein